MNNNLQVVITGVGARCGLQGSLPLGEDRSGTAWVVPQVSPGWQEGTIQSSSIKNIPRSSVYYVRSDYNMMVFICGESTELYLLL